MKLCKKKKKGGGGIGSRYESVEKTENLQTNYKTEEVKCEEIR